MAYVTTCGPSGNVVSDLTDELLFCYFARLLARKVMAPIVTEIRDKDNLTVVRTMLQNHRQAQHQRAFLDGAFPTYRFLSLTDR